MGGTLSQRLRRFERPLLVGAAGFVVALAAMPPLVEIAVDLARAGAPALRVLASPRPWWLLARSTMLAATVTLGALAIGVPLGVVFARARIPARRALFALHTLPMLLPPFLPALGWFHLFGMRGALGSDATAAALFSAPGLVTILTLTFAPIATSLTALGVSAVDPSLEEAARLVARPLRVAARILVPVALPAVLLAALLIFALTVTELGVPMFLRQDVYPAAVFARLAGIDDVPGEAAALVLPLVPIALGLLVIERRYLGRRAFTVLGLRGFAREPLDFGAFQIPVLVGAFVASILSVLPLASLALRAARDGGFSRALAFFGSAPTNSLILAGSAATVIAAVGVVLGHALARGSAGARFADGLMVFTFFLPAAVLGVGLIVTWNRASTQLVYGSLAIAVIGFVARYAIVGARVFAAAVAQSSPSFEEAAATAGAGYLRRLVRVVLPMHRRAAMAAWLVAAIFCMRDLETAVLFYPPGGEPLTVRIFTLEANGSEAVVAALAVAHVGLTLLMLLGGSILLRNGRVG